MPSQRQENAKTLAALLGLEEDEAADLLHASVLISYSMSNPFSREIGAHAKAMLERTIHTVEISAQQLPNPDVEIVIGGVQRRTHARAIWVNISADEIEITANETTYRGQGWPHPIFSLLAACHACAKTMQSLLGNRLWPRGAQDIIVKPNDLLGEDLECLSHPIDLGESLLAGAGAVSNGFLLALHHLDVRGHMSIIDPKQVRDGTLNRCLFFDATDVGLWKADQLAQKARTCFSNLTFSSHQGTVQEYIIGQGNNFKVERMIVGVDSRRARRSLQTELPREIFDASTTGVDEVVLHFNSQPNELACMSCIYKEESGETSREGHIAETLGVAIRDVRSGFIDEQAAHKITTRYGNIVAESLIGTAYDSLFKALCSIGQLKQADGTQVLAPFSFVSVLAGTYLALELSRRVWGKNAAQPFNYWRVSPWHSPVVNLRQTRSRLATCEFCSQPTLRVVCEQLWGSD